MAKYIQPGIYENLVFSEKTNINDKGTLELHFGSFTDSKSQEDLWITNDAGEELEGKFLIFPPMMYNTPKGSDTRIPKTAAEVGTDLRVLRKLLVEYAKLIGSEEAANKAFGGMEPFKGIGIAEDKIPAALSRLNDENFMKKVYTNMVTKFVGYIKSVKDFDKKPFRHKFFRKNEKESFAVIPNSTLPYPFESMLVPKEASKIEWTKWETDNKKNDATPAVKDAATKVAQADSLFADEQVETAEAGATGDSLI